MFSYITIQVYFVLVSNYSYYKIKVYNVTGMDVSK